MPPKKAAAKGGKGAKKKEGDGPDVSAQMKRVKAEVNKVLQELQVPPEMELDKLFVTQFNDFLTKRTNKLLFQGDRPGVIGTHALSLVIREVCPSPVPLKTLCFWRCMVGDEGLKYLCQNVLCVPLSNILPASCDGHENKLPRPKWTVEYVGTERTRSRSLIFFPLSFRYKKKNEQLEWPGFQHLELFDVRVSPRGCEYLSGQLAQNIPLVTLILDFNAIGDEGVM